MSEKICVGETYLSIGSVKDGFYKKDVHTSIHQTSDLFCVGFYKGIKCWRIQSQEKCKKGQNCGGQRNQKKKTY